ncbi:tyrosine-type recombinase/integrase [Sphingorhabdus contaminans]|uniref:tyrosine-type recombinase/integrase n=1 Tax=Sphingorhabdus contaminans TaxID=1343899 RepID=UPI003D2A7AE8
MVERNQSLDGEKRPKVGLTDAKIKGLIKPLRGQVEYADQVVPGLRLRVGASGQKTFILRKRVGGQPRNITIGRFGPRCGLLDARRKARQMINDIEAGSDPSKGAKQSRQLASLTIRNMLPDYLAFKASRRRIEETERVFKRNILPEIGDRLADSVTRGDVTRLVDKVARTAPVQARNVCAQLSAFYTWALPRLDRLASNPCRDAGRPPAPKARDRVLSDVELAVLWNALDDEKEPWTSAIRLLILTGQRRNEVYSAEWTEIDMDQRIWTIPAVRAKNGKAHIVPLSDFAMKIVDGLERLEGTSKLFPAKSSPQNGPSGFSKVQARLRAALQKELGDVEVWRLHDLRRTVATGLQRIGVRLEVTEAVLNHVSGSQSGIVGVYQRYNFASEKRVALVAWAEEVQCILKRLDN